MIEIATLPSELQALALVALVFVEAVVLYVGYGVVENRVAPPLIENLETA